MDYTKEPWEEIKKQIANLKDDWFELDKAYIHFSNLKALLNDSFIERSKVEHLACVGITNEALEAGVVGGCIEIVGNEANKTKETPDMWMGVKVWEDE